MPAALSNINMDRTDSPTLSEQGYNALIKNLKEVVFQLDAEGCISALNPAWASVTGFSLQEGLGQPLYMFIYPEERDHAKTHLQLLLQGRVKECRIQARYLTESKRLGWMDLYAHATIASDESIVISGSFADITEHKAWEQRLTIERAVTAVLADSVSIGEVRPRILKAICQSLDWDYGELWMPQALKNRPQCIESWSCVPSSKNGAQSKSDAFEPCFELGIGIIDQVWQGDGLAWLSHLEPELDNPCEFRSSPHQTAISMPILDGHDRLGVMIFFKRADCPFDEILLKRLRVIGGQIGEFIMRLKAEEQLRNKHLRLQSELREAAAYISALLPPPLHEEVDIVHQFIPSNQLGGDAFDYYWLDRQHLALYLLDVSGHGVRSTLLSVGVLNLLRNRSLLNADFYQPQSVLRALNHVYQMDDMGKDYFTIWYGVYNRDSRTLCYSSAGHPPALLFSPKTEVQRLFSGGHAVGLIPDVSYKQESCVIAPQSTLYLFSDGVYEIVTRTGKQWQLKQFVNLLTKYHQQQRHQIDQVFSAIARIQGHRTFSDDYSLIQASFSL